MMFGNAYMRQNDIAVSGPPDHDFVLSGELSCLPAIRCGLPGDDEQDALPTARGTVVDTDKVAVMQLAERGLLDIDRPVSDWLPAF